MSDSFTIAMGEFTKKKNDLPFRPGEKLTYKMVWNMIPVGMFTVEIKEPKKIDDTTTWHFQMRVRTNDFADTFYKVRNFVDSYAEPTLKNSLKYDFIQNQGKTVDTTTLTYADGGTRVHVVKEGKDEGWSDLPGPCVDPLTMFYSVRMQPIARVGQILYVWVSDGEKTVKCPTLVAKKETLTVNDADRVCWLLEPDLKELHGVFQRSRGAKLRVWVSADQYKIPLRIASRVVVGSFQGRLVEFRPGVDTDDTGKVVAPAASVKIVVADDKKEKKVETH